MVKPVERIQGQRVVLIPYDKEHVPCYHKWLQDPQLLEATASDPLSLEDHYELQESWISDPSTMAGDVNIFLNDPEDAQAAEIDIMIAESRSRGKGLAKEAVQLMIKYSSQHLHISKFRAKIDDSNSTSLHLFRSLGFQDMGHSDVFQQVGKCSMRNEPVHHCLCQFGDTVPVVQASLLVKFDN